MKSGLVRKWVMSSLKPGHQVKSCEKPCVCRSRGYIFSPMIMKLGQKFSLMKSRTSFEMGHFRSITRSLDQMLEKPCVRPRGHISRQIIMKLGQNFYLNEKLGRI